MRKSILLAWYQATRSKAWQLRRVMCWTVQLWRPWNHALDVCGLTIVSSHIYNIRTSRENIYVHGKHLGTIGCCTSPILQNSIKAQKQANTFCLTGCSKSTHKQEVFKVWHANVAWMCSEQIKWCKYCVSPPALSTKILMWVLTSFSTSWKVFEPTPKSTYSTVVLVLTELPIKSCMCDEKYPPKKVFVVFCTGTSRNCVLGVKYFNSHRVSTKWVPLPTGTCFYVFSAAGYWFIFVSLKVLG